MADMQDQADRPQPSQAPCGVVRHPNTFAYDAGPGPSCGNGRYLNGHSAIRHFRLGEIGAWLRPCPYLNRRG